MNIESANFNVTNVTVFILTNFGKAEVANNFLEAMGALLSADLGILSYEHWMPEEDPTFYVPASMSLTFNQRQQLEAAGLRQGEPFILTNDGALTKPTSKTMTLRGIKSTFSIRKGSLLLFEEAPGSFSLEFEYYTEEAVILEIHACAVDGSSAKHIKLKQSGMKWGPFRLNCNNNRNTHKESHQTDARAHKHIHNDGKRYELVDAHELDEVEHKPDSTHPTIPSAPSTDNVVHYTQWSSRKFQHKQLAAPLTPIALSQLSSLWPPVSHNRVYDVVIIVTSAEHVAARLLTKKTSGTKSNNFNLTTTTDTNNTPLTTIPSMPSVPSTPSASPVLSTSQARTMRDTHKTHSTWLSRQSPRKVLPTRAHSIHAASPTVTSNSSGGIMSSITNNNHAYEGIPPVDLAENPHTDAYRREHSSKLDTDENVSSNMDSDSAVPVRRASRTKSSTYVSTGCSGGVEREAFFFRVNQDSYNKRHTATASTLKSSTPTQNHLRAIDNPSAEAGAKEKARKPHRHRGHSADIPSSNSMVIPEKGISNSASESLLEDFTATRAAEKADSSVHPVGAFAESRTPSTRNVRKSSIFMRSKGIALDLSVQLFQVPTGVYSRLTLYGMENFIPQTNSTSENPNRIGGESSVSTTADSKIGIGGINNIQTTPSADTNADCIICLTNKQNTIMFPCRHLCLCAECASILASQTGNMGNNHDHQPQNQEKKCPVCRKPVVLMFQLKP